jgi:pilus assembly protein CpaB
MRRPGNILLLAIVIGALSAAWVYRYLRSQQAAIEAARSSSTTATVDVIVANATIPIGSRIEANQVKIVRWPAGDEPEGTFHTPEAVAGNIARTTIEKNEPLIQSQLVNQQVGLLPLLITDGMRGMSVKVDSVTGVSGFITPSSRVDVLVSGTPEGGGGGEQMSKVVLQNIRVLATGTSIEHLDNKPVEVPTVTLLVSPEDAEKLTIATRQEPVRLALRNFHDEESVQTSGVTVRGLFGRERKPPPPPPPAAAPVVARRHEPSPRYSVEVILGEKVTRQELF